MLRLGSGDRIVDADGPGAILRGTVGPRSIASWRSGRLIFRRSPLADVARQLAEGTGMAIGVDGPPAYMLACS